MWPFMSLGLQFVQIACGAATCHVFPSHTLCVCAHQLWLRVTFCDTGKPIEENLRNGNLPALTYCICVLYYNYVSHMRGPTGLLCYDNSFHAQIFPVACFHALKSCLSFYKHKATNIALFLPTSYVQNHVK